jgi:hypothetical protein
MPGRQVWPGSALGRWSGGLAVVAILVGVPVALLRAGVGVSPPGSGALAALTPAAAPTGWSRLEVPLPHGVATIGVPPPPFAPLAGDPGTASAAVQGATGLIHAYLNVTPRQGDERLRDFATFRVHFLAGEHDQSVHREGAAEGSALHGGHRSCVLDSYVTRIGHHHYRELACFVVGDRGGAAVVVAAAAIADWDHFEPQLRRAVASFAIS